ncbi:PAQR family membrane homeostasis protein TrhA [Notoacmeibacter ruber]|uniref:Hemolysin III n=1 Tax=Notoacmeibacter ruber TaxID=2670375 RepID=A0A3L7JDJ0_9HYPH|nr:hemolysin III family protein [Notoacmeibacter ruber]RLQ87651.1 hemolysin III [Notoacmeibacter ruber]
MPFPNFTAAELYADGIVHTLAMIASAVAVTLLLALTAGEISGSMTVALSIYGGGLFAMFACSAIYNLTPWHGAKGLLRRFDQAAIFLMIAGTYTPLVVLMDTMLAYFILAVVWSGALAGVVSKLFFAGEYRRWDPALYLGLSWCGVVLIGQMLLVLPVLVTTMIFIGGLCYSVGVVFHVWESLKFHNVVWHSFVLAGAICHFIAVAHGTAWSIV